MPLSRQYEVIYIHIPRTGGTSVYEALDMDYCRHYKWKFHYRNHHRLWKKYHKFAIVRNPYKRAVSIYNYIKLDKSYWHSVTGNAPDGKHKDYSYCNNHTFKETIQELYNNFLSGDLSGDEWQRQYPFIYDTRDDKLMIDTVLRFKDLPHCFDDLMNKLGINNIELPNLNSSQTGGDYMDYYDGVTKEMVGEVYKKDFELLGYSWGG